MERAKDTRKCAVVLLSGGLDSATVTAWLQREGYEVIGLTIDYGQKHRAELEAATAVATALQVKEHLIMRLDLRAVGGSALTSDLEVPKAGDALAEVTADIPVTYVPARNTIFLSLALGLAEARGAHHLGIGVNALDYSGYPDCRPEFVAKFGELANLATREGVEGRPMHVHTPLLDLSKVEILSLAHELSVPVHLTLSCYDPQADATPCKLCDACRLRIQAEREFAQKAALHTHVDAGRTWHVRHRNLRQGQPFETVDYGEVDRLSSTVHLVLTMGDQEIGCATIMKEERAGGFGYRIRGMAVDEEYRGYGFGRRLMEGCQNLAQELQTGLWCNARNNAIPSYVACGFQQVGEEFDIPNIGPHFVLEWTPCLA